MELIAIRPVSDLLYKFPEIEKLVDEGQIACPTQKGHGAMAFLSLEKLDGISSGIKIGDADLPSEIPNERLEQDEDISRILGIIKD
jgi:hypothetical protein